MASPLKFLFWICGPVLTCEECGSRHSRGAPVRERGGAVPRGTGSTEAVGRSGRTASTQPITRKLISRATARAQCEADPHSKRSLLRRRSAGVLEVGMLNTSSNDVLVPPLWQAGSGARMWRFWRGKVGQAEMLGLLDSHGVFLCHLPVLSFLFPPSLILAV
ncbi:hypothetical protein BS50DRAFT_316414 [Corynespora cassiicola Philippines]|uniref:Arf-GAP domain-containing protein n=1 Tax=Corynespora cassiicola Philippines TaxID=1448308 RepID=A0A2T2NYR7_CORCC|nr:hypothetical protein BS50DRAFT_316414 [Corynespora cassiicola Philippines]